MATIETFKAFCTEKNIEIIYSVQIIKASRNRNAKTESCSYSDLCTKADCRCNGGDQNYIKLINKIKGEFI